MARQKRVTPATAYRAAVRSALEHIADPVWLGRQSPLASPYFLGRAAVPNGNVLSPLRRGALLQETLGLAAASLWGSPLPETRAVLAAAVDEERATLGSKSPRYHYYLLELRYFRRHYPPSTFPTSVESIAGFVNVSPTRFFVHLEEAIDELARRLHERLTPALRLETPAPAEELIGRAAALHTLVETLEAGRAAAVTGMGGVGKTTVGAALVARWPGLVFWHTFRPGLNDDLNSVLFNLGHFVNESGAPSLWAQLLAEEGRNVSPAQALGMLRLDLAAIADRQPLLCFDEVDLLQTSAGDPRRRQHTQVLEFLDGLRELAPLLLIGQRVFVDTDTHVPLEPLGPAQTSELLARLGVALEPSILHQVQQFTRGNPRLLQLYAALHRSGDEARDVLRLAQEPSAQPLFSRLWRRLDDEERNILNALAVFRSHAPADAWAEHAAALESLCERHLVKRDLGGGVALLPFFRELVYDALPPDLRPQLHHNAALLRAQYGDYTATAYHYLAAGDAPTAVEVWFAHQDEEVLAGQAAAAAEVFGGLDPHTLDARRRAEWRVIRNRLSLLAGEIDDVLAGMEGFTWEADDETTAAAIGQWAQALHMRDRSDDALERYDEAITMLSRATTDIVRWRMRRGFILGDTDAQAARNEAQLARCDIERLEGMIAYNAGQYDTARDFLNKSLQIAESAGDRDRAARVHQVLAYIAGRQGRMDDAETHADQAMAYFAAIGDRVQLEGIRAELAGMYLNVRQFEAVIEPSERALAFFERIGHQVWLSHIRSNLAEAYMETGRLAEAKAMAYQVLRSEIAHTRPNALYTLGHIHEREGNAAFAAASYAEGIAVAQSNGDAFVEAYLQRALGALSAREGHDEEAQRRLTTAAKLFAEMGLTQEVAETERIISILHETTRIEAYPASR